MYDDNKRDVKAALHSVMAHYNKTDRESIATNPPTVSMRTQHRTQLQIL